MALPRGIRNNNPLNIRKGNTWKGEKAVQTDSEFEQFDSMLMGLRAGIKLIRNYVTGNIASGRQCRTIDALITRWAPPSENNTEEYIKTVEKLSGINRHARLYADNRDMICRIVQAMVWVECGHTISLDTVRSAWELL